MMDKIRRKLPQRSQGGFTLLEVMLVSAISSVIVIPVLAWILTGFRTQAVVQATSQRTLMTTQLAQILPRDMASARAVLYTSIGGLVNGAGAYDCSDADPSDVVAASILLNTGQTVAVYAAGVRSGQTVVVRRTCAPGQPTSEESILGEAIRSAPAGVLTGSQRTGGAFPAGVVGGIDIVVQLPAAKPITISGSIRTGVDP